MVSGQCAADTSTRIKSPESGVLTPCSPPNRASNAFFFFGLMLRRRPAGRFVLGPPRTMAGDGKTVAASPHSTLLDQVKAADVPLACAFRCASNQNQSPQTGFADPPLCHADERIPVQSRKRRQALLRLRRCPLPPLDQDQVRARARFGTSSGGSDNTACNGGSTHRVHGRIVVAPQDAFAH